MRFPVLAVAVLLVTGAVASAQNTPAPSKDKLDGYLEKWEQKMREVKTLNAKLTRTDKDKVFDTKSTFEGTAQYARSGEGQNALNLAALELKVKGGKEFSEKMVCTGTYLYVFVPAQKEIRAYELPKGKTDGGFLDLLFGMKADDVKKKYNLTLSRGKENDPNWIYVDVAPKDAKDKADFARARLVLDRKTYLPRQLWFEHSNGNEVTWEVPSVQTGVTLDCRLFDAPKAPNGWKLVPVAQEKAPRVDR